MLTILAVLCALVFVAFVVSIICGLIAISPVLVVIICLPLIDIFIIKRIFKGKKK